MRSYVKFKVVSAQNIKLHQEVIYGSMIYIDTLQKNKWYTMYVDINLGTQNGSSDGEDFAVYEDELY